MEFRSILTVSQVAELNPAFSEATLRWWIFNAERNGFSRCLIRIGGRVYIDRAAFDEWLNDHRVEADEGYSPSPAHL